MSERYDIIDKYHECLAVARRAKRELATRREAFDELRRALQDARMEYAKLSPVQRLSLEEPPNDAYGAHWA